MGFSPAILLVAIILVWNGKMMETYTTGMMAQVKQIQLNQLEDMENNKNYQEKTDSKITVMDSRLIAIETREQLLGLQGGKMYYQPDFNGQ